jgi:ADP-ribose pyrophosphatase
MAELPREVANEVVYRGKLFDLEVAELELPDGVRVKREIVRHPGAVCMVPVDDQGRVLMVTQYRHAAGKRLLELPAGTLEKGEAPLETAVRELQEEVGRKPGRIEPLGGFYVAPGYTTEYIHLFVCMELEESGLEGDEDEDIEIEAVTREEAERLIGSGEIVDAKSIAGILRWLHFIHQ